MEGTGYAKGKVMLRFQTLYHCDIRKHYFGITKVKKDKVPLERTERGEVMFHLYFQEKVLMAIKKMQ
jgi:hypothetical protein